MLSLDAARELAAASQQQADNDAEGAAQHQHEADSAGGDGVSNDGADGGEGGGDAEAPGEESAPVDEGAVP